MRMLVVDEADLLFSYGYEEDMNALLACMPAIRQTMLMVGFLSLPATAFLSSLALGACPRTA